MQRSQPFSHSISLFCAIEEILSSFQGVQAQAELAKLPPYQSRGKGKANSFIGSGRPGAGMANLRAARKARNVRRHRAANR